MDVEAMACELLASGYLVQVRDGAQQQERTKNTRSCLQNLRHRFIVCLGWCSGADAEPDYLPEPLVVEPRFREQFLIAHPTPQYESLLQVRMASLLKVWWHSVSCVSALVAVTVAQQKSRVFAAPKQCHLVVRRY
eukprot:GHUV01040765.1.p1 GENE.GHUV01040765.1~~GHUV01040765.1.p1  ORF type:complete len:145 (-),score=25.66 GHUV01040765.1:320-724(-)